MNALLEDILAGALLITVAIAPGGEDNPPSSIPRHTANGCANNVRATT